MKRLPACALLVAVLSLGLPPLQAAEPVVRLVTSGADVAGGLAPEGLREALGAAAAGDEIRFAPGLVVELAGSLRITSGVTLQGPVVLRGSADAPRLIFDADSVAFRAVTFRDLGVRCTTIRAGATVAGPHSALFDGCTFEGASDLFLDGATDSEVHDCTFRPSADLVQRPIRLRATTGCYVTTSTVVGGPSVSFLDEESEDLVVEYCDFAGSARLYTVSGAFQVNAVRGDEGIYRGEPEWSGSFRRPPPGGQRQIDLLFNHARRMALRGQGITAHGNVLGERALEGVAAPKRAGSRGYLVALTVTPAGSGFKTSGEVTVSANTILGADTGINVAHGEKSRGFAKVTVSKNTVRDARHYGLRVTRAGDLVVEENRFESCGTDGAEDTAISVVDTSEPGTFLRSDQISDTRGHGVAVRASHDVQLSGMNVTRSTGDGLFVAKGRGTVSCSLVELVGNAGHGVHVLRGGRAVLDGCTHQFSGGAGLFAETGALALVRGGRFEFNDGPGIDLAPAGPTPNSVRRTANRGIAAPTDLEFDAARPLLRGRAEPHATVEVWRVGQGNDDGRGEGGGALGVTVCDGAGRFEFPASGDLNCSEGDVLTATASFDDKAITSEFSENVVCPPRPDWFRVESGTTEDLTAVWVRANDDAWAVGANGTVLHWDGAAWSANASGTAEHLSDVVALSANEVYVTARQELRRWDGAAWSVAVAAPPLGGLWGSSMWGSPETGVFAAWAIGQGAQVSSRQRFYRYPAGNSTWVHPFQGEDGTGYNRRGTPGSIFEGVWGVSATEIWCVTEGGSVYRYDGNSATTDEPFLGPHVGRFDFVHDILETGNRDLWAGGGAVFTAGRFPQRFDGAQWTPQSFAITPNGSSSVWGGAADDVWQTAEGAAEVSPGVREAAIFHFDGTAWRQDGVPARTPPLRRVRGVTGGLRVAVGDDGTILHHR